MGSDSGTDEEKRRVREQAFTERVLIAREEERSRIARELHDETSQALTSLMVGLETLRATRDLSEIHARAQTLSEVARGALLGISRLIQGLRPAPLEKSGLLAALRDYAQHIEAIYGVCVESHFTGAPPTPLDPKIESGLYRMVHEAMTNAAKHALADQLNVTLHFRTAGVRAVIEDDGVGFEPSPGAGEPRRGIGLRGVSERATALGGTLSVESTPGQGTIVAIDLPLEGGIG